MRLRFTPRKALLALLLAMAFVLLGLEYRGREAEARLRADLVTAVARGADAPLDLATSMPLDWERVVVVNPYTSQSELDSLLGFRWNARRIGRVMHNDFENALLFVRGKRVVRAVVLERRFGDFCCFERNGNYERSRARFLVVLDAGWPRLRHDPRVTD